MNTKKSKPGTGLLNAVKAFLVTAMLAVTVGIWSLLSRQYQETQAVPAQTSSASYAYASENGISLLPIPTLVPLKEINQDGGVYNSQDTSNTQPTPALRKVEVAAPTKTPGRVPLFSLGNGPITSSGSSR